MIMENFYQHFNLVKSEDDISVTYTRSVHPFSACANSMATSRLSSFEELDLVLLLSLRFNVLYEKRWFISATLAEITYDI